MTIEGCYHLMQQLIFAQKPIRRVGRNKDRQEEKVYKNRMNSSTMAIGGDLRLLRNKAAE